MNNATAMKMVDSLKQLVHNQRDVLLLEARIYELAQLATIHLLHHKIHSVFILVYFFHFNDPGMPDEPRDVHLRFQVLHLFLRKYPLVNNFDSQNFLSILLPTLKNRRKLSRAKFTTIVVLTIKSEAS